MNYQSKKRRLYQRMKANRLPVAPGFKWRTSKCGKPCEQTLKRYQKFVGIPQTGTFNQATMDALFPEQWRKRIADLAKKEVGVHETTPNWGARIKNYLAAAGITFPTAWCAAFVVFILHRAGYRRDLPPQPAWVPSWADWARKTHRTVSKVNARKGDLVCLNWPGTDPTPDHIAIVTGNLGALKRVTTVGGNEGDAVRQGWRPYSYLHTVIRVDRFRRR
mgnify:CR=1 FL=1